MNVDKWSVMIDKRYAKATSKKINMRRVAGLPLNLPMKKVNDIQKSITIKGKLAKYGVIDFVIAS